MSGKSYICGTWEAETNDKSHVFDVLSNVLK
jgi:hypothetical protein